MATVTPVLLSMSPPRHDAHPEFNLVEAGFVLRRRPPLAPAWTFRWGEGGGRGIVVIARYEAQKGKIGESSGEPEEDPARIWEERYYGWDGEALPAPACPGTLSPDGRYAAVQEGGPYFVQHFGVQRLENPWPSVVVTDAATCVPIFRVRSAHTYGASWRARWLPTSEGFVVGVRDGYAIARVGPEPAWTPLPDGWPGPDSAPTGGGRYFGYGSRVYDASGDRWYGPDVDGPFWWGASHREHWFHSESIDWGGWGTGRWDWLTGSDRSLLLPPKIEYPPFAEEIAFRVARTGSCLSLREEPGEDGRVLGCLPDGARLLFAERDAEVAELDALRRAFRSPLLSPHSSIAFLHSSIALPERDPAWVYVRTGDGAEGWVNHGYLDHD